MAIEDTIYSALSGDVTLTALVGERIYPEYLPEDCVFPAVVFSRVNTERQQTYCGRTGFAESAVEVVSIAQTLDESRQVAGAVIVAMEGIEQCSAGDDGGDYEQSRKLHQVIAEFSIFHSD